ncbi:hypothetical protein [Bizionia paragorgiae]|uniref:hypothetical protein n=1 Tax=Bizionia paragorgiae TaxID=283786 RepID=UPI003A921912
MRNLVIIGVLLSGFFACSPMKESVVISPNLLRNLELIIEKHDSLVQSTPSSSNFHIYNVRFDINENDCYVIIGTSNNYNTKLMDGYLLLDENLIVFENAINNPCNHLVTIKNRNILEKELSKYASMNVGVDNYRGHGWVFRIEGESLIPFHQSGLKINFNIN